MTIPQGNLFSHKCQRPTETRAGYAFQCHNHFCFQPLIFIQYATYHMCSDIMYSSPSPFWLFSPVSWSSGPIVFNGQFIGRLTSAHWHTPMLHLPVGADAVCWKRNWSEKNTQHNTHGGANRRDSASGLRWTTPTDAAVSGPIIAFRNHVNVDS